jgi:hypothetical protein
MPDLASREAAVWVLLVLALAGWWVASRHATRVLREERRRVDVLRGTLQRAAALAKSARGVRCDHCRTDWAAVHDLCDVGAVRGDAVGTTQEF